MSNFYLFKKYYEVLSLQSKTKLRYLIILLAFSSLAELFSFSLVLPFLTALLKPEVIYNDENFAGIKSFFSIESISDLQIKLTLVFSLFTIFSTIIRVYGLKFSTKTSFQIGSEISVKLYDSIIRRPYESHIKTNSNTLVNSITYKSSQIIYGGFLPVFSIVTNSLVILSILIPLFYFYPGATLKILAIILVTYLTIILYNKAKIKNNGLVVSRYSDLIQKQLKESLANIRDIILDNTYGIFVSSYQKNDLRLKDALGKNQYIGATPRYYLESGAILVISLLCYYVIKSGGDITTFIPSLAIFLIAFQRILPSTQNIYYYWTAFLGNKIMMMEVIDLLYERPEVANHNQEVGRLKFNNKIELKNISFSYSGQSTKILHGVSLEIFKGDKIAVLGETGSGKSTLIDLVMGLLQPQDGQILIDGVKLTIESLKSWQQNISHVPQVITLMDSTIRSNIIFGRDSKYEDSEERLAAISDILKLNEFMDKKKNGFDEQIGEGGVSLSGGQRQRLGIARALYKDTDLYVFDEATSALDNNTEDYIYEALFKTYRDKTFILITHNHSALKFCNKVFKVSKSGSILQEL